MDSWNPNFNSVFKKYMGILIMKNFNSNLLCTTQLINT
jgi:hypothetical protein